MLSEDEDSSGSVCVSDSNDDAPIIRLPLAPAVLPDSSLLPLAPVAAWRDSVFRMRVPAEAAHPCSSVSCQPASVCYQCSGAGLRFWTVWCIADCCKDTCR